MRPKCPSGFRFIGLTSLVFVVVNLTIFGIVSKCPSLLYDLALSPTHPSGIVTAIFTHYDVVHLASNLIGFTIVGLFFVVLHMPVDLKTRQSFSKIFGLGSFLVGIGTNVIGFGMWGAEGASGTGCAGASGMVYGAMGILLASSVYNIPRYIGQLHSMRWERLDSPGLFIITSGSIGTAALLSYMPIFEAGTFFYVGPKVAWLLHELGFLFGFLAAMSLFFVLWLSKRGKHGEGF
jgi:membrane associated rhomboid family serine protease